MTERLDKFIASQTPLSRKDAGRAIRDKRVTVNGTVSRAADAKIDPAADIVALDGQPLTYRKYVYYMMNKPAGVVSATEDKTEKTVLELLPAALRRDGIFPAGRLDKDTTGLLILTDDGDYAHRMLSPKKHVDKTYIATLDREPDASIGEAFQSGIVLSDGTRCKEGQAVCLGNARVEVTIHEGRYHQVKRMFAALGYRVMALQRVRIGGLSLDPDLREGDFRPMSDAEAALVFDILHKKPPSE